MYIIWILGSIIAVVAVGYFMYKEGYEQGHEQGKKEQLDKLSEMYDFRTKKK